jgi:hypothetical protein
MQDQRPIDSGAGTEDAPLDQPGEVCVRMPNDRIGRTLVVLALAVIPITTMLATDGSRATLTVGPATELAAGATERLEVRPAGTLSPTAAPTTLATAVPSFTVSPTWFATSAPTNPPSAQPGPKPTARPTATPRPPPTPAPTPGPTPGPAPCTVFPSNNVWNRDISTLPVRADSTTLVTSIGLTAYLHPDFSATGYGIPINKVNLSTPRSGVTFQYADESDPGPYPIPANPKIEGGSDRHLILWDTQGCELYEIYDAVLSGGHWTGGSGAIWDLRSNALRPPGWTSADAAGLPILPGLVRYVEVAAGAIRHALRFTAPHTRTAYIYPARHQAGESASAALPPMGLRVRLKASVDISGFGPQARVILTALKRYGMLLADNGSPWYVTGAPDARWNDDELHALQALHGSDFEAVDTSGLR